MLSAADQAALEQEDAAWASGTVANLGESLVGQRVKVESLGIGQVMSLKESRLGVKIFSISFDDSGEKKICLDPKGKLKSYGILNEKYMITLRQKRTKKELTAKKEMKRMMDKRGAPPKTLIAKLPVDVRPTASSYVLCSARACSCARAHYCV